MSDIQIIKEFIKKVEALATATGEDIKALQNQQSQAVSNEQLTAKFDEFKQLLFGGDVSAAYDTFKEIGDKLQQLDGSVGEAITQKLAELKTEIDGIKNAFGDVDFVAAYNRAKAA